MRHDISFFVSFFPFADCCYCKYLISINIYHNSMIVKLFRPKRLGTIANSIYFYLNLVRRLDDINAIFTMKRNFFLQNNKSEERATSNGLLILHIVESSAFKTYSFEVQLALCVLFSFFSVCI